MLPGDATVLEIIVLALISAALECVDVTLAAGDVFCCGVSCIVWVVEQLFLACEVYHLAFVGKVSLDRKGIAAGAGDIDGIDSFLHVFQIL